MLILRKDGTLVYYPVERAVTLGAHETTQEGTLPNGTPYRMICQWGEKVLRRDPVAYAEALKAEGLSEGPPSDEVASTSTPIEGPTP